MRSRLFATFLLWLAMGTGLAAEPFRWDARVQRGQLDNGFTWYVVGGGESMGARVSLQLLVRAGSLDERGDQSGVAHMVEHMVFHATRAHPGGLGAHLESLGWRIGKHYNAQTNFERTLYQLSAERRRVNAGLGVLAEIAGGALIPAEGLERERRIILEEWRTKLGVRERMDRQRRAMLREGSLYPERPTIGTERSIREQPAAALRAFYADWYRPNNMALIVVGNVDAAVLRPEIERVFGTLVPAVLPERNGADPRLREQLRIVRLQDAESGTSQVGWVTRFAADVRQDEEGLRERIVDRIAERSLRALVRREAAGLPAGVASLTSSRGELGESTASLGFAASVTVDGHRAGLRHILLVQERVRREGMHPGDVRQEIEEVRRLNDKGPAQQAARDMDGWTRMLGEAVGSVRVLQDPLQKQAQIRRILAAITVAEIDARVRGWVDAPDRALFMIAPGLSPLVLPTPAEVEAERQALARQPLPAPAAPKQHTLAPARLPDIASAGTIVRDDDLGEGVRRWTLANGDMLVWRHAPDDASMRFAADSGAGYRLPEAPAWQWQLAAQLGRDADVAGQEPGELARWSADRQLRLAQEQTETRLAYTAQVSPAAFEDLLRLYAARQMGSELSLPALEEAAGQLARQAARRPESAGERAASEMARLRFGVLPRDAWPEAAALRELATPAGLQTIGALWRTLGARPVTYFVSGPADEAAVRAMVERRLAGIPRDAAGPAAQGLEQRGGYRESRLTIGSEPQGSVRAMGSQALRWTPQRAMRTAILSRLLHRALRQELREKEAGIYRLQARLTLDPQGRLLSELSFTAAPERLDALWSTAKQVLEHLPERLDAAVLDEEIRQMRADEARRRDDHTAQFNRLQLSYRQYGDARYLADSWHLAADLTPDSVRELAGEFALARDLAVVKVLPNDAAVR